MTDKEYKLQCEVEKLKKENKELKNKNKDLEAQKKTYYNKLQIQNEQLMKYKGEDKTEAYNEIKRKYDIAMDTIVNITKELAKKSQDSVEIIKQNLIEAPIAHSDETGVRINGEQHWLHTLCNNEYVSYGVHKKRGKEAIEEMELLKFFTGTLMHDHFKPYYQYEQITHAECNAHIIRYLKSVIDVFHRKETEDFLTFLVDLNKRKKELIEQAKNKIEENELLEIENKYKELLENWKTSYYEYIKEVEVFLVVEKSKVKIYLKWLNKF